MPKQEMCISTCAGVVADCVTGIHNAMVSVSYSQQELHTQGRLGVPTEDSNLAWSVEAMQCTLWFSVYLHYIYAL
jgi:hypothetical protein